MAKWKGVSFNDRELAGQVRTLTLEECKKHLKAGKGKMYTLILSNLSKTVLPRLNELSGEDGKPLVIQLSSTIAKKHGIKSSTG